MQKYEDTNTFIFGPRNVLSAGSCSLACTGTNSTVKAFTKLTEHSTECNRTRRDPACRICQRAAHNNVQEPAAALTWLDFHLVDSAVCCSWQGQDHRAQEGSPGLSDRKRNWGMLLGLCPFCPSSLLFFLAITKRYSEL